MGLQLGAKVHVRCLIHHNIVALEVLIHQKLVRLQTTLCTLSKSAQKLIVMLTMIKLPLLDAPAAPTMLLHFVLN